MPVLIRIILQRILVGLTAVLAFFGIDVEVDVPTTEEANIRVEERKDIIVGTIKDVTPPSIVNLNPTFTQDDDLLSTEDDSNTFFNENKLDEIAREIDNIRNNINQLGQTGPQQDNEEDVVEKTDDENNSEEVPTYTSSNDIRDVSLNIICTNRDSGRINVTTGSGTLISSQGVVLTNAHVAQFFLLEEYNDKKYDCILKKELIPTYGYKADLLFIPEDWVEENYYLLGAQTAIGTGENDYALLKITANTNPTLSLPSSFPYVNPETNVSEIEIGAPITLAGFPGFGSGLFNFNTSSLLTDNSEIEDILTFRNNRIDVFESGETRVAQRGSSGGGSFKNGKLLGVITTISPGNNYNKAQSVSLHYIDRDIREETGSSLSSLLSRNASNESSNFEQNNVPNLREILIQGF